MSCKILGYTLAAGTAATTLYTAYQVYEYGGISNLMGGMYTSRYSGAAKGAIKGLDISGILRELGTEFSKAIKDFDLKEMLSSFGEHQEELRTWVKEHGVKWINDSSQLLKTATLNNLPWVALGSIVITGTPLLLRYLYHSAVENIGMPKLVSERKSYTLLARLQDAIVGTWKWCYNTTSTYLLTNLKVFGATLATSMVSELTFRAFDMFGAFNRETTVYKFVNQNVMNTFYNLNIDFVCSIDGGKVTYSKDIWGNFQRTVSDCDYSQGQYLSFSNLVAVANILGLGAIAYNNFKAMYSYFFEGKPAESKPIFSDKLQAKVDEITNSIANIKRHGGFLPNVLLYGPGGTGKTMIAKYIARNSGTNYVMMSGGDLAQYISKGKHVTKLNELMEWINNQTEPTVLFIDECEALCGLRTKDTPPQNLELINAFLNHTGEPSKKLMLIMATNSKAIDPAVLSRCDYKVPVLPPAKPERIKILNKYVQTFFSSKEIRQFFGKKQIENIADQTDGLTGRALFKMLNAVYNKRCSTRNNCLTEILVKETVTDFIEQERELEEYANEEANNSRPPHTVVQIDPHSAPNSVPAA